MIISKQWLPFQKTKRNSFPEIVHPISRKKYRVNTSTPGWANDETLACYGELASQVPAGGTIIEVGCGLGICTWALALNAKPGVKIYALDAWPNTPVNPRKTPYYRNETPGLLISKEHFLAATAALSNVTAVPANLPDESEVLQRLPSADLFIIDVTHTYHEWYETILLAAKKLTPRGIIAGNDYLMKPQISDDYKEIKRAVEAGAYQLQRKLSVIPSSMIWWISSFSE